MHREFIISFCVQLSAVCKSWLFASAAATIVVTYTLVLVFMCAAKTLCRLNWQSRDETLIKKLNWGLHRRASMTLLAATIKNNQKSIKKERIWTAGAVRMHWIVCLGGGLSMETAQLRPNSTLSKRGRRSFAKTIIKNEEIKSVRAGSEKQ